MGNNWKSRGNGVCLKKANGQKNIIVTMLKIERTNQEIIIRLPADLEVGDIQRLLDYLSYKRAIQKSQATQEQIDALAKEVKQGWWEKNKGRFPGIA